MDVSKMLLFPFYYNPQLSRTMVHGFVPYQSYRDDRSFVKFLGNEIIQSFIARKIGCNQAIEEFPIFFDKTGADLISTFIQSKFQGTTFLEVCLMLGNIFEITEGDKKEMILYVENYLETLLTTTTRKKRGIIKMCKKRLFKRISIETNMVDEFKEFRPTKCLENGGEIEENGMKFFDNESDGTYILKECKAFKKALKNTIQANCPFVYTFTFGFQTFDIMEKEILQYETKHIIYQNLSAWIKISEQEYALINGGKVDMSGKQNYIIECEKILIVIFSRFILASINQSKLRPSVFQSKNYAECLINAIPSLSRKMVDELIELIDNDFQLKKKLHEELDDIKRIYDLK